MAELTFRVPGMTNEDAVRAVTLALRNVTGISSAQPDRYTLWVVVVGERLDIAAIRAAVAAAGFDPEL